MKTNRTYNPCDDCQYSYSKTGQESNTCKICEFMYFRDLSPKQGRWIDTDPAAWECSVCHYKVARYNNTSYCPACGAKMKGE